MARQVEVSTLGGPEVLEIVDREVGTPGSGQVRIAVLPIGVNLIDVHFRTGL